jgi:hypothetical protein
MTVCSLHTYWIPLSWILKLKYLWPLDLLSRNDICKDISMEVVPAQPSLCPIMMIKSEKMPRSIGQIPAGPLQNQPLVEYVALWHNLGPHVVKHPANHMNSWIPWQTWKFITSNLPLLSSGLLSPISRDN